MLLSSIPKAIFFSEINLAVDYFEESEPLKAEDKGNVHIISFFFGDVFKYIGVQNALNAFVNVRQYP